MKPDLLFLTLNSEKMMQMGGYYSLFIISIHVIKDLKTYKTGGFQALKEVRRMSWCSYQLAKTFSVSVHDNSAVFNPG